MTKSEKGIITKGVGGLYEVRLLDDIDTAVTCRARGKFRQSGISPLPGDTVTVMPDENDKDENEKRYVIDEIIPRVSSLIRPAIANLTHLFILIPSARPSPDLLTCDKLTIVAEDQNIEPVIIVSKTDLDEEKSENLCAIYRKAGYNVFPVSSKTGQGTEEIRQYITSCAEKMNSSGSVMHAAFAGASGTGKSTLTHALFPFLNPKQGETSRKTGRGRHTTRQTDLYLLKTENNVPFFMADTPGFSLVDFASFNFFSSIDAPACFREFSDCLGKCRYTKCTHTKEEGCAVLEKMEKGLISPERHDSYIKILSELKAHPEWKRKQK